MSARSLCSLALVAALATGCRRSPEVVRPELARTPTTPDAASSAGALAPPPPNPPAARPGETPHALTPRASTGPTQWFDPPAAQRRVFDVGGTIYLTVDRVLYRVEGEQMFPVPVRFADPKITLEPEIIGVSGRPPGNLWLEQISNIATRTLVVDLFRLRPDGLFVQHHDDTAGTALAWDGERRLLPATGTTPARWLALDGRESPATLKGPAAACTPTRPPASSRGWALATLRCSETDYRTTATWLFDPSDQGRPLAELANHSPLALLVRASGDTWLVASPNSWNVPVPDFHPLLCHLVGGQTRCQKIPTNGTEVWALAERGADLTFAASDGLWGHRDGSFTHEPLTLPGGSGAVITEAVRDRQQRIWGVAHAVSTPGAPVRYQLFRHTP